MLLSSGHLDVIHVYRQEQSWLSMNKQTFPIRFLFLSFFQVADRKNLPFEKNTTGSSMLFQDVGLLCRGGRIEISGNSDNEMLSNLGASSFGGLDLISITFGGRHL